MIKNKKIDMKAVKNMTLDELKAANLVSYGPDGKAKPLSTYMKKKILAQ
jgi:hypothetical protein